MMRESGEALVKRKRFRGSLGKTTYYSIIRPGYFQHTSPPQKLIAEFQPYHHSATAEGVKSKPARVWLL